MTRLPLILVAAATAVMPAAVPAQSLGHYVATPAQPAKVAKVTTRGTTWFPRGERLLAARAAETPAKLCQLVAKKVGPLAGFAVEGRAFDQAALDDCNGTAAATPETAVASAN